MIRTGIYGGSFNPIHTGHTTLGKALVDSGMVDELWFLVSPQNPLKKDSELLDDQHRLELARIAVEESDVLRVSDFEFTLPRPSYMINTLEKLESAYPHRAFTLVIGADNWERFPRWYKSEEILAKYPIIVYPRPGFLLENVPETVQIADTPLLDISSTEIRERISQGKFDGEGLHPAVWKEIQEKGYYK